MKARVFVYAPVTLGSVIGGDRVNEVARLRELSQAFELDAYLIIETKDSRTRSKLLDFWFEGEPEGIHLLPIPKLPYGFLMLWRFALSLYVSFALLSARIGNRVDLVLTREAVSSLPVLVTCRILRIKSLYNVLSVPFVYKENQIVGDVAYQNPIAQNLLKAFEYSCFFLCDYIGVASPKTGEEIVEVVGSSLSGKTVLLPYPVPAYFFDESTTERQNDELLLHYLGQITGYYDFAPLMDAVENMANDGVKIRLKIIGSGTPIRKLANVIKLRNSPYTSFETARLPRHSIPSLLRSGSALVLPLSGTTASAIPIKCMEAMALGVPVVVSNPTDPKIFMDKETCLCVLRNTPGDWQAALIELFDRPLVQRIIAGGRRVAESFRPGENSRILLSLISQKSLGPNQYPAPG